MSKVLLNKKNIVRGLVIMIRKYRDNTILHSYSCCKLCQMYYDGKRELGNYCGNCLNTILSDESSWWCYPCVNRAFKYPKLGFSDSDNNQYIADFWSEVLELVKISKSKDILELSDEFRLKVLDIAEKYKAPPISTHSVTSLHSVTSPQIVINEIPLTWIDKIRKLFFNR